MGMCFLTSFPAKIGPRIWFLLAQLPLLVIHPDAKKGRETGFLILTASHFP